MILYYHPQLVSKILRENAGLLETTPFISGHRKTFEIYEKFGLNSYNAVYDRTGNLPHFLNISPNKHNIPDATCFDKSFYQVSVERSKELLSSGKPINVMWSGGLDSTYLLYMLYECAEDKSQVKVLGTYNSIIESGDLFDKDIKQKFKFEINVAKRNDLNFKEDEVYVSGMCGNQLFGPTDDMFATDGVGMFHHTLGTPETIYEPYEKHINPEIIEFMKPMIDDSPRKIETIADLRWYCIFNLDWYTAIYEHKILLKREVADNIHGFFNSEDFQRWAVTTKEPFTKIPGNPNTHRWQMREVLADMGLKHYAENKTKKISTFSFHEPSWIFLTENYQNIFL